MAFSLNESARDCYPPSGSKTVTNNNVTSFSFAYKMGGYSGLLFE